MIPDSLTSGGQIVSVAKGSNRLNSNGLVGGTSITKTSGYYDLTLAPDTTIPIPAAGDSFYVTFSGASINIRPNGGIFNAYVQGTGLRLRENSFAQLEIQNTNAFPVVCQVFVGFDAFIDKRLILNQVAQPSVAYPTYPVANAGTRVDIPDLSGTTFADINGNSWIAVSRNGIYISNLDGGNTLLLQKKGSVSATGPAILAIFPLTSIVYPVSGDYCLFDGGGNINAIVSEDYTALSASSA